MPKPIENGRKPLENVFWGCAQHPDSCCKARWVNRLQAMPLLQRQALQAALAQVDNGVGLYRQG